MTTAVHLNSEELEAGLDEIRQSPKLAAQCHHFLALALACLAAAFLGCPWLSLVLSALVVVLVFPFGFSSSAFFPVSVFHRLTITSQYCGLISMP